MTDSDSNIDIDHPDVAMYRDDTRSIREILGDDIYCIMTVGEVGSVRPATMTQSHITVHSIRGAHDTTHMPVG